MRFIINCFGSVAIGLAWGGLLVGHTPRRTWPWWRAGRRGQGGLFLGTVAAASARFRVEVRGLVVTGSKPVKSSPPASLPASYCAYLFFSSLSPPPNRPTWLR
jgi:hypothetical protein